MNAAARGRAGADGEHPAAAAWRALGPEGRVPGAVEPIKVKGPARAIYRLPGAAPDGAAVVAKRSPVAAGRLERTMYEEVLPRLPVSAPRYYGAVEDADGPVWIFLEDAGTTRWSPDVPEHRVLAARWLGALHVAAADLPLAGLVPDRGPPRYLAHLAAGRRLILDHLGNPALRSDEVELLRAIVGVCDAVERRWPELEEVCASAPSTLVHGDFRPKNVLVRGEGDGARLLAVDWEMCGWGAPAPDLAPRRHRHTAPVDLDDYCRVVRERWPAFAPALARRLVWAGLIFQRLAAIEWASVSKVVTRSHAVATHLEGLRIYHHELRRALCEPAGAAA